MQKRNRTKIWSLDTSSRFLENGESLNDGAKRETKEETRADVEMGMIYSIFNIPQINQIYVIHLATLKDLSFGSTSESLDVKLFSKMKFLIKNLHFLLFQKL